MIHPFSELCESIRTLLEDSYELKPRDGPVEYQGIEVTHPDLLVSGDTIAGRLDPSCAEYHDEQGRDRLDLIISAAVHLGIQQGLEIAAGRRNG